MVTQGNSLEPKGACPACSLREGLEVEAALLQVISTQEQCDPAARPAEEASRKQGCRSLEAHINSGPQPSKDG